jgi:hypothetical protein
MRTARRPKDFATSGLIARVMAVSFCVFVCHHRPMTKHAPLLFDHRPCVRCKKDLPAEDFYVTSPKTGRRSRMCKKCYAKHRSRETDRRWRRTRRERLRQLIRSAKAKPCADCGVEYPYYVMQFDHKPEHVKEHGVSRLSRSLTSEAVARAEILKCDVVCANCHAQRTWMRMHKKSNSPRLAGR